MFLKLELLPSSGKNGKTENLAVELASNLESRSPGLRLAQPGGPTARVSVLPFVPEDGRSPSFRNVVI
jgi:hypothetical protein